MPAAFLACVKKGGRVRTIVPKKGVYVHVCYLDGKAHRSEIHHKKKR